MRPLGNPCAFDYHAQGVGNLNILSTFELSDFLLQSLNDHITCW